MPAPLVPNVYTPVPQRTQSQTDFDNNADFFLSSLPPFGAGINALAMYLDALAETVDLDAATATLKATEAMTSANQSAASATAAANSLANANAAATSAAASATTATQQAALAAASVASGAKPYATYAAAIADVANLALNQIIMIVTDETRLNQMSLYQKTAATVLTFLQAAERYSSPVSYVQSDSIQNMITKLLVLTGVIPQSQPFVDANFNDPAY